MKKVCFPLTGDENKDVLNIVFSIVFNLKEFEPVVALNTENKEIESLLKSHNIKYSVLGINKKIFPKENFLKNFLKAYISSPAIFSFLMENRPNIIHIFDVATSLTWNSAVKMNGSKIVMSQNSYFDYNYPIRTIIGMADIMISPSKSLIETMPGSLRKNAVVITPPTLYNEDDSFDLKKSLKIKGEQITFGIKSSDKAKTIALAETLYKSFNKKISFVMDSKKPFEINDEDIEIKGIPYPSFPEGCDAFIIYDDDNFFDDLKRAFKYKVPVFAVRNNSSLEFIDDGETGFLIDSKLPEVISEKILSLWDIRHQVADVAFDAKEISEKDYACEIEKIYKGI